ncbi:MAG: efflux RND transporter periplasmic adaptor subunit [Syntrophales bacterium]|nr:efflux RND transporter periplasmic adaptor subunit [Syntrophales bacterium]MDD5642977.1 efflux RND transporter periplasmic adaptor subunit [Syntrophales bacterium]
MVEGKRSPIRKPGRAWALGIPLTLLALALACGERNTYAPPPPPQVTVSQPLRKPVTDYLEFTGNAVAYNTVPLRARVEGFLEKVYFQDGQTVKKGAPLFLIQQEQYQAQLQKAEASVLAEKAQLEHAQTEFDRYSKLVKQDAAAQTDVDRWHYERDSRQAALLAAKAQVALAKLNLSYTKINAPFKGRMGRHLKDPGTLVGAGEKTLLAEINQIDPMYVYFNINEQDLLRVRGKKPEKAEEIEKKKHPVFVGLADEEGYPHKGWLDFAAISLNPTTGSLQLRAILRNQDELILPGLFARVRAPIDSAKEALLVPETSISYDQLGPYVRLVNEKNTVERRQVKLGVQEETFRVVLEGLTGKERVVVSGLLRAVPGRQVTPVMAGAEAEAKGAKNELKGAKNKKPHPPSK